MYMRFWYCHRARKSWLGSRYGKRSTSSRREADDLYQTRSWRGRPLRWVTRSRGVMRSPATESYNLNVGRYVLTGVSHSSLPSSTNRPMAMVVNAFVHEAMGKRVGGVTSR